MTDITTINGAAVAAISDTAAAKRERIRYLLRRLDGRRQLFGNLLAGMRRELGELCDLTGTDGNNVFVHMDGLDTDVRALLSWCRRGKHDAHCEPAS